MKSHNKSCDAHQTTTKDPVRALDSAELPRPTAEEIRLRAYEIYVERGRTDGQEHDDWIRAERELSESIRIRSNE